MTQRTFKMLHGCQFLMRLKCQWKHSGKISGDGIVELWIENKGICKLRSWSLSKLEWQRRLAASSCEESTQRLRPALFRFTLTMSDHLFFLIFWFFVSLKCPVCFSCGFSAEFLSFLNFFSLALAENWTVSRDDFRCCVLFLNLLQCKVNPAESFANLFFFLVFSSHIDHLKKQLWKAVLERPDHLRCDCSGACHLINWSLVKDTMSADVLEICMRRLRMTLR